jgi:hypothetical protein
MGIIVPRKGKKRTTYKAVIRIAGHPTVAKTFRSYQDAKVFMTETESQLYKGQVVEFHKSHTFKDMVERYDREVLQSESRAAETIRTRLSKSAFSR